MFVKVFINEICHCQVCISLSCIYGRGRSEVLDAPRNPLRPPSARVQCIAVLRPPTPTDRRRIRPPSLHPLQPCRALNSQRRSNRMQTVRRQQNADAAAQAQQCNQRPCAAMQLHCNCTCIISSLRMQMLMRMNCALPMCSLQQHGSHDPVVVLCAAAGHRQQGRCTAHTGHGGWTDTHT